MKKGIILESSSSSALIAEVENDKIKRHQYVFSERDLSNQFLSFLNSSKKDLSFIGVGVGPGAYTGVRISLTIAKSFSYAFNIPIVTFPSLNSFIPETPGDFLSVLDAKIGGVYASCGQCMDGIVQFTEPCLYSIDEIILLLKNTPKIVSPHIEVLKKRITTLKNVEWILKKPDAKVLAEICFSKLFKKNFTEIENLKPIYLRDA